MKAACIVALMGVIGLLVVLGVQAEERVDKQAVVIERVLREAVIDRQLRAAFVDCVRGCEEDGAWAGVTRIVRSSMKKGCRDECVEWYLVQVDRLFDTYTWHQQGGPTR